MVRLTVPIPGELKTEMDRHPEINWSEIAKEAIYDKLILLKKMDALLETSTLTEEDALELGKLINKKVANKYKEMI